MSAVLQSEHLVGLLMRTCWAHEQVVSWTHLWGVCKLWCDVWLENDQAWVTYFLRHQNFKIHCGLERERYRNAVIVRLRKEMLRLDRVNGELGQENETLRQDVWELRQKVRDVERLRGQLAETKVKLSETKVYLQDANKTVFELQAKDRLRSIEDSRVVRERWLKPGRPALVGGDQ